MSSLSKLTKAMAKKKINLQGKEVRLISEADSEYICITDIAKAAQGNHHGIVKNYSKNRSNIEFLGLLELFKKQHLFFFDCELLYFSCIK